VRIVEGPTVLQVRTITTVLPRHNHHVRPLRLAFQKPGPNYSSCRWALPNVLGQLSSRKVDTPLFISASQPVSLIRKIHSFGAVTKLSYVSQLTYSSGASSNSSSQTTNASKILISKYASLFPQHPLFPALNPKTALQQHHTSPSPPLPSPTTSLA